MHQKLIKLGFSIFGSALALASILFWLGKAGKGQSLVDVAFGVIAVCVVIYLFSLNRK